VARVIRLQDSLLAYTTRCQEMELKVIKIEEENRILKKLNDTYVQEKQHIRASMEKAYDELRKKASLEAENADLKRRCFEATGRYETVSLEYKGLKAHTEQLERHIDQYAQRYNERLKISCETFERIISKIQRDTVEWTNSATEYMYGTTGKRFRADAQRELFRVDTKIRIRETEPAQDAPIDHDKMVKKLAAAGIQTPPGTAGAPP